MAASDCEAKAEQQTSTYPWSRKAIRICVCGGLLVVTLSVVLGFLIGWFSARITVISQLETEPGTEVEDWWQDFDPVISRQLKQHINRKSIEENLRWLSAMPRLAGTQADQLQAKAVQQMWRTQGLDTAGIEAYNVLLSYPGDKSSPNKVQVVSDNGSVVYEAPWETEDDRMLNDPGYPPHTLPYAAYCDASTAEGELVYINYGQEEDYTMLESYSIDLRGKILLARSGWSSMHQKAILAAKAGAVGLLVYPDAYDNAPLGSEEVFPHNWWLPHDATRQEAATAHIGDPLTPGYSSKEFAFRESIPEVKKAMCPVPSQPISYSIALELFSHIDETASLLPDSWIYDFVLTGVTNKHHRLGGIMKHGRKVKLVLNNRLEKRKIYNAFGMVRGSLEPDRLVIIGGHRDAWGHGAIDPGGGSAVLLEISAAVGKQLATGWRPRRTIVFASWGGEEFGMIGSTEWVQEHLATLTHKAVAYLNLDVVVFGKEYAVAEASPLLSSSIIRASQQVSHPIFPTLYNAWENSTMKPRVQGLQAWSDWVPFYDMAGIPSLSLLYKTSEVVYPAYHTKYDTFDYVSNHVDPGFLYHGIMGEWYTEVLYSLTDSLILPFDLKPYGTLVMEAFQNFQSTIIQRPIAWLASGSGHDLLKQLEYCVYNFTYATETFSETLQYINITSPYVQRHVNDQLMLFERAFIDTIWQENKFSVSKHVLFSRPQQPCSFPSMFPGISDALCHDDVMQHLDDVTVSKSTSDRLHQQIATVCHALYRAVDMITI